MHKTAVIAAVLLGVGAARNAAYGAYPTRVLTAAEPERALPQLHLGVGYERIETRGLITREWATSEVAQDVEELEFEEVYHLLNIRARVGLFRDLELRITAPLVLAYDSNLSFSGSVGPNSTVYAPASDGVVTNADNPADSLAFPITAIPSSRNRAGLGDMRFGLAWSPIQEEKDLGWPTLTLVGEVTAPTGEIWDPADINALTGGSGGAVGRGLTVIDLGLGLSKRAAPGAPAFDPYFQIGFKIPIESGEQRDRGMEAPLSGRVRAGTELVVYEDPKAASKYAFDLSVLMRFIGSGRTYSPLSDYLPSFDQTQIASNATYDDFANPDNYRIRGPDGVSCSGERWDPDNNELVPATPGVPCGELNQVDEHIEVGGRLGIHVQPSRWTLFRAGLELVYISDHILTNEEAGADTDPPNAPATCAGGACAGRINASNASGQDERSPYYDPRYDAVGRRFRFEDALTWKLYIEAIATF